MYRCRGNKLSPENQAHAKRVFPWRSTGDHPNPLGGPMHFIDDEDWLTHTTFWMVMGKSHKGRLAERQNCVSYPTWPNNPEIRAAAALLKEARSHKEEFYAADEPDEEIDIFS
jgi:hypothetical protein